MSDGRLLELLAEGLNDALKSLADLATKAADGELTYEDPELYVEVIAAAIAERDRLRNLFAAPAEKFSIMAGWLVYEVGEHTCGGYGPESGYMHEPGCGFEPVLKLSEMHGWPESA